MFSRMRYDLGRINSEIYKINGQISSGRRMSKLSDDPTSLVSALGMRSTVAEIAQYQENLGHGTALISAAESALRQIKDQVMEAKTLAISAQTPVVEDDRHLMAPAVANLLDQAVTLANTQIGGKYIFGGYRTSGYTEAEPMPFIKDQIDGYRLNGAAPAASAPLGADELKINGIWVPAALDDSATAKAAAVNSISDQTGVTAELTPALVTATAPVDPGTLDAGDLVINGVDIFAAPTPIQALDSDNVLLEAINAQQAATGVYASRDSSGSLVLKAVDGRNIEVTTTAAGEAVTHLNGAAGTETTYGRLELLANRTFMLESALVDLGGGVFAEPGFIALGLDGGTAVTGEPTDVADDGKIAALTIADLEGNVRYAGDRDNVLEIKVGKVEKIAVSQNGQVALKNTEVFAALKELENTLLGKNFTEVTSLRYVTDVNATFASGATGLPNDPTLSNPEIVSGSFTVNVVDHDHVPPETFAAVIPVDINTDTPATIAAKLDGIPGINAAWNLDGYLEVTSADPERYTFSTSNDSSNFTEAVRINNTDMQVHALNKSIGELSLVMEELTTQISDFGARGNRIDVQSQIFTNLDLAVQENLSEKQDTDLLKAITELQAAENAYEAALASTARTMQMSLLDYL
jgi:flagellin-like hook-associated protein FlgL